MKRIPVWAMALIIFQLPVDAQQLEEILQAHFKAAAQEKMEKIKTMITHGTNRYAMGGIESAFTIYQARPDKIRIESFFQGSGVIQTYNGQSGYMVAPSMGVKEPKLMTNNELKSILSQADFENPLWNAAKKGDKLELLEPGPDDSDDHVQMTTSSGEVFHFFIDRESHLISSIRSTQVLRGASTEITTVLKEYKSVRGIPVAFQIQTRMNGETVTTISIEKVEFNKKIDSTLFEKPVTDLHMGPSGGE
jgi:outer membrane lipoprotein-sorting protein